MPQFNDLQPVTSTSVVYDTVIINNGLMTPKLGQLYPAEDCKGILYHPPYPLIFLFPSYLVYKDFIKQLAYKYKELMLQPSSFSLTYTLPGG